MASFEYVIVAACVIGAVAAVLSPGTAASISAALTTGIDALGSVITSAVAG